MPAKTRGGGTPTTSHGHTEEASLTLQLDVAFDVETLVDTSDQMGDLIVRRRAADERDARQMAAVWHQQRHAIQSLIDGLARATNHAIEARRMADQSIYSREVAS